MTELAPLATSLQLSPSRARAALARHSLRLLFVTLLLVCVIVVDEWKHVTEFVDLFYLVPIALSAVMLTPLETAGFVFVSLMGELISEVSTFPQLPDEPWGLLAIALVGLTAVLGTHIIRTYIRPLRSAAVALDSAPLLYAEFEFPSCRLIRCNQTFAGMTDAGRGQSLFDLFAEPCAGQLASLLERAAATNQTECLQLQLAGRQSGYGYWQVDFIPVAATQWATMGSVTMLAVEQTAEVQRTQVREAAIRFSSRLMGSTDIEEILRVAIDSLADIAQTNAGGVCLIEEGQWVGKVGYGQYSDVLVQQMHIEYHQFHSGVIAAESRETIAAAEAAKDVRFNQQTIKDLHVKSALVVPLVVGRRTIGVAWLTQTDRVRDFSDDQVKFCTIMGSQAAAAISNAKACLAAEVTRSELEASSSTCQAAEVT